MIFRYTSYGDGPSTDAQLSSRTAIKSLVMSMEKLSSHRSENHLAYFWLSW